MRFYFISIFTLILIPFICHAQSNEARVSSALTNYASEQIRKGLLEDENLLLIAEALNPENEKVMAVMAYLDGDTKPKEVDAFDSEKMFSGLYNSGHRLLPYQNEAARNLAALYLLAALEIKPTDPKAILDITKLEWQGQNTDLNYLLSIPHQTPRNLRLAKKKENTFEVKVASALASYANNLMIEEDELGTKLNQAALLLDPDCDQAILTMAYQSRELPLKKAKSINKEKLVQGLANRALELINKQEEKSRAQTKMAVLYLAIVLALDPVHEDALREGETLEAMGEPVDLEAIFINPSYQNLRGLMNEKNSLLAHWTLDDTNGFEAVDRLGKSNGLLKGNLKVGMDGIHGSAYRFDGKTNYIEANGVELAHTPFTISAWLKPSDCDRNSFFSAGHEHEARSAIHLRIESPKKVRFGLYADDLDGNLKNIKNKWTHIVATLSGKLHGYKMSIYQDGRLISSKNASGFYVGSNLINIGRQAFSGGAHYSGLIDDVRVYNQALSPDSIKALFQEGKPQ